MSRPYPMGVGLETDMETGEPMALAQFHEEARRDERRAQALERHQQLLQDLAGQGGAVLQVVASRLAQRINSLIAADPEAAAYLALLDGVEQSLTAGERLAQEALERLVQKKDLTSALS